jgi:hypothetical protein
VCYKLIHAAGVSGTGVALPLDNCPWRALLPCQQLSVASTACSSTHLDPILKTYYNIVVDRMRANLLQL